MILKKVWCERGAGKSNGVEKLENRKSFETVDAPQKITEK